MYRISFFLNGKLRTAVISPATNTLSFLRINCGLTGTKEGCSEGDCGACTIVVGAVKNRVVRYQAINSCLMPALRMHGKHIITIEGIGTPANPHPIQKALLDFHGVQCGYCTPGIVMSLFGLFINKPNPSETEINDSLEGNLCRCTGYESIKKAAVYLSQLEKKQSLKIIPDYIQYVEKQLLRFNQKIINIPCHKHNDCKYIIPSNIKELLDYLNHNREYKIINGGTDLMVDINIKKLDYKTVVDISQIKELDFIKENKNSIIIGANVTLSEILTNKTICQKLPLLYPALSMLGSKQIRNTSTISGNIANASPIADAATALLALRAKLILRSSQKQRKINLKDFYLGYKKTALKQNEIIYAIIIPVNSRLNSFEKTAKRKSVDIASVNSAVCLQLKNNIIKDIVIALGGVAEYPIIADKTCRYLLNKKIGKAIIEKASQIAMSEIKPISDLRGSAPFRRILVRNHIIKHFIKLFGNKIN